MGCLEFPHLDTAVAEKVVSQAPRHHGAGWPLEEKPLPRAPGRALLVVSGEMAVSSAWCSVLPLWLLWGAACSRAASRGDNTFPFDIEGSSAVSRRDPPETSEPRVAPGRLPPTSEVQCPPPLSPCWGTCPPRGLCVPPSCPLSPLFFPSPGRLEFHLDQVSSET